MPMFKISILDIFIFHFLMNFIMSKIKDIFFENEEIIIKIFNNRESYFHVLIKNPESLSNYIKISINEPDKDIIPNDYIIAFYGNDSSFNNIKQISNLISPKSYLYLSKNEIQNEFYFRAQHKYENKTFEIKIIPKSFCELYFNSSTISYFVTKENKNMDFIIKSDDKNKPIYFNHIILWIYGNKDINVNLKLNESNYFKHSKYNAYIIKQKENNDYIFSVLGTVGDSLDIGFIVLNEYNFCKNCKEDNMELYKVFLKKNILNYMCFDIFNYYYHYIKYFDDDNDNDIKHYQEGNRKECFQLPAEKDEIFFSYHYLANEQKYNLDIYYIQLGKNHYFNIEENKTYGFLPLRLEEDYHYLKYYIRNLNSDLCNLKVYFGTCKNYPFCFDKKDIIKKQNLIQNLGLFSYSFNKSEINKIISHYENNKYILFIEFIKRNLPRFYFIGRNQISIMIYTDKTYSYINSFKNYKFIKKNDIDKINYQLDKKDYHLLDNYDYFVTIELISGDISFDINNTNSIINNNNSFLRYKNMYTYYLNKTNIKNYNNINIKAKKNSIYNIMMNYFEYDDKEELYRLNVGGNFIFNIHPTKKLTLHFYPRRIFTSYTQLDWEKIYSMFIVFYPFNCDVEIKNKHSDIKLIHRDIIDNNNKNIIYYQDIGSTKEFTDVIPYEITPRNKFNNDKCLMYVSTYFFDTISLDSNDNSIILKENFPQKFIFNRNFQKINFSYYFIENNQDIIININKTSIKKVDLQFVMNINDKDFRKLNINLKENIIEISNEELKNFIQDNQINKIFFTIILSDKTEEAIVNIIINSRESNGYKIKKNNCKFNIIYLVAIFFISILFYKFGFIKKNKTNKNNKLEEIELIDKE